MGPSANLATTLHCVCVRTVHVKWLHKLMINKTENRRHTYQLATSPVYKKGVIRVRVTFRVRFRLRVAT